MPKDLTKILDLLAEDKIAKHVLKALDSKKPINVGDFLIKLSSEIKIDSLEFPFLVTESLQKLLNLNAIDKTVKDCKPEYTINETGIAAYEQFSKYGNKKQ